MAFQVSVVTPERVLFQGEATIVVARGVDELSDDDKLVVARARKIQRFLAQPMFVAEAFTSLPGQYVRLEESIRGFDEIVRGLHDDLPEEAFYMVGNIDMVVEKAQQLAQAA